MQDFTKENTFFSRPNHPQKCQYPPDNRKLRRRCNIGMIIIVCVMFAAICAMSKMDVIWPCDRGSNLNVLMSGENFANYGFWKLRFTPLHYIGPISDNPDYYLHYPPLPNIINGLMRIAGINSLAVMRVLCGALFVIGIVCMYRGFARIIGSLAAVCGAGYLLLTMYFYGYGVSLHSHTYNLFFMGLFFLLFLRGILDA